jgi:hypothetical protein
VQPPVDCRQLLHRPFDVRGDLDPVAWDDEHVAGLRVTVLAQANRRSRDPFQSLGRELDPIDSSVMAARRKQIETAQ